MPERKISNAKHKKPEPRNGYNFLNFVSANLMPDMIHYLQAYKLYIFFTVFTLLFLFAMAVPASNNEHVLEATNREYLQNMAEIWEREFRENKVEALRRANEEGWPIRYEDDEGAIYELMKLDDFGAPVYYGTDNAGAAVTSGTDALYPSGSLGLGLQGSNMTAGIWEGGGVRISHQELTNRVTQMNNPPISSHASHVAGTMIASGIVGSAQGMSYESSLIAYDWNNDNSEMALAASNGLLISNHSYGTRSGWQQGNWSGNSGWHWHGYYNHTQDFKFGWYNSKAETWDDIAYNAPYYLIVKSAGNNRSNNGPSSGFYYTRDLAWNWTTDNSYRDPNNAYNTIPTYGNAKNILTVGAVENISGGYSNPQDVNMSNFSNWGPTDDGRIKPDLVAKGVSVYSTGAASNTAYYTSSGTSMSAPVVSGSLLLLQKHYHNLNNVYMQSSTLKGLAIHTAHEAGNGPGPDYQYGWGLFNAERAAEVISNTSGEHLIIEETLNNQQSYNMSFYVPGNKPVTVTLSWTDPKGNATGGTYNNRLNNPASKLVHDLDLRLHRNFSTWEPFILNPANPSAPATTGDNYRDNVEKIIISNPDPGIYSISVNHKGSLNNPQDFSIIISGTGAGIQTHNPPKSSFCVGETISVGYTAIGNFNSNNVFTAQLSSTLGNFFNPFTLGTTQSNSSGTIFGQIPWGIPQGVNYRVRVVSSNPAVTGDENSFPLSIYHYPNVSVSTDGPTEFCEGESVTLTTEHQNSYTYQWKRNGNDIPGATSHTYTASTSGSYSVQVTNHNTCSQTSENIEVQVNELPEFNVLANGNMSFCQGDSVTFNATGESGYDWQWFVDGNEINGAESTDFHATNSGDYFVKATDQNNCNNFSDTFRVSVWNLPKANITNASDTSICENVTLLLSANYDTSLSYQWYLDSEPITSAVSQNYNVMDGGAYTIEVSDSNSCINTSKAVTVEILPLPESQVEVAGDLMFCEGESITFKAENDNVSRWQWFHDGEPLQNELNSEFTAYSSGEYYVVTENNYTCSDTSSSYHVIVNPLPFKPEISESESVLQSNHPEGNQWYDEHGAIENADSRVFEPEKSGMYYVAVTDDNNCTSYSDTVNYIVNQLMSTIVISEAYVYPNPSNGIFKLEYYTENIVGKVYIEVYNTIGQSLYLNAVPISQNKTEYELDLKQQASGVYMLRLSHGDYIRMFSLILTD